MYVGIYSSFRIAWIGGCLASVAFSNESTYKRFVDEGREADFDRRFEDSVIEVRREFGKRHPIYIDGKERFCSDVLEERSPIDGAIIGYFQKGTREDARLAIGSSKAAFEAWRGIGYRERAAIMVRAAEIFRERKFRVSAILSIENGKSRYESMGEVDEAIDFLNYYSSDIIRNRGYIRRERIVGGRRASLGFQGSPGGGESISIRMRPYGVFGVIAPFNFPISISVGMSTGALITGNTVVFKPSSTDNMTMLTGLEIYNVFKMAGVPGGVFNFVTGPGSDVGDEIANNPDVSGVVFTGSKSTGLGMMRKGLDARMHKVFVVEMGGKNPAIVSKYADIDTAVSGVVSAAFGYSGQKCSALSRVYVQRQIKEEFISRLIDRTRKLSIGNPLVKGNYVGPLISESAYKRYAEAVEIAKRSGRVLYGGNRVRSVERGFYVEPSVVEVGSDNELMRRELFAPILAITSYEDIQDALRMANDTEYGLCAALYSKNRKEIRYFSDMIDAGVVYINRESSATTGAIVGRHTFVGWKWSGTSGKGTGSRFYLEQFMREQSLSLAAE